MSKELERIKVVELRWTRPGNVPEGWIIFNAPRPIYGHMDWLGRFVSGTFYTAVDPDAPEAEHFFKRNRELDARRLEYITQAEWEARVDAYAKKVAEDYGIDVSTFDRADIEASYQNYLHHQGRRALL